VETATKMWITYKLNVDYICTSQCQIRKTKIEFYFGRRCFVSNLATPQEKTGFVYNSLILVFEAENWQSGEAKLKK
jgi:hypothetical protein